jgi:ABC-2 type transport system permease protein
MQNHFSFQLIEFVREPGAINLPGIFLLFMLYTVLGYLFYSTLFAAVGSLCDDDMQSQNFTLPITIPIILSLFIMFNVIDDPHTPLAFWASIIPFSSPVVMMARVAFHVPVWQVMLSVGLLIVFFVGSTWMAGKIYRMGILIYGKKFKWRDLWRFIRV